MIASEERRVRVGAPGTRRSTVRPKLPSAARPTLPSTLRPTFAPPDDPLLCDPLLCDSLLSEPLLPDLLLPTTLRLRLASMEEPHTAQVGLAPSHGGEHRGEDEPAWAAETGYPAEPDPMAAPRPPVEDAYAGATAHDPVTAQAPTWEDAAPLRASPVRRQSRWVYAVSRQVMFGTARHVVASACVVAAIGLMVAGVAGLISHRDGATTAGRSVPGAAPDKMAAIDVRPPSRPKISLSVNVPATDAPADAVEPGATPPVNEAPGAEAAPSNPAAAVPPEAGAQLEYDPGKPQMPPIGPPGGSPREDTTQLVAFDTAPFPYNGLQPGGRPFLDIEQGGRRGHRTWYGATLWQDQSFNDNHVLVHVPPTFDPNRPGVIVVFFHGYGATLQRDILARQQVPKQISDAEANAVLLAPQFAVDSRDSSAGRFWEPGGFARFLDEAAKKLAALRGDPSLEEKFARMPVVVVGYSGGFVAAAYALKDPGVKNRVRGVLLLDAVYGELDAFTNWAASNRSSFFISAYTRYTQYQNAVLQRRLAGLGIASQSRLDGQLARGSAVFLPTGAETNHNDFVTQAWVANPIKDVLSRLPDISLLDPQAVASISH